MNRSTNKCFVLALVAVLVVSLGLLGWHALFHTHQTEWESLQADIRSQIEAQQPHPVAGLMSNIVMDGDVAIMLSIGHHQHCWMQDVADVTIRTSALLMFFFTVCVPALQSPTRQPVHAA